MDGGMACEWEGRFRRGVLLVSSAPLPRARARMRSISIIVILLGVAVLAACPSGGRGADSSPSQQAGRPMALMSTGEFAGGTMSVTAIDPRVEFPVFPGTTPLAVAATYCLDDTATPDMVRLVPMSAKFELVLEDGTRLEPSIVGGPNIPAEAFSLQGPHHGTEIAPGACRDGLILFEVPRGGAPAEVAYSPSAKEVQLVWTL